MPSATPPVPSLVPATAASTTPLRVTDALTIGGPALVVIAGPCSVEGGPMLVETARAVRRAGATMLRGGAYKPRTSPHTFQGLGDAALEHLAAARAATGLPVVTEVVDPRQVERVAAVADVLQVGARNMQNYALLAEVGRAGVPVLLKRGLSATLRELLLASEHVRVQGNERVILCERGIRTFETYTRNTFDINAVAAVKELSHLPIIADPSHATGKASLVNAVTRAAIAAGADGIIIEVHPNPEKALKDGAQSLLPEAFVKLMHDIAPIAQAVGRHL